MNSSKPNLMTLLSWAERLAKGERCAEWEAWRASDAEAARLWAQVSAAEALLDEGKAAGEADDEIPAEELAALLDGGLAPNEAVRVERSCARSVESIAEALSTVRVGRWKLEAKVSQQLENRLLALGPQPQHKRMNGVAALAQATSSQPGAKVELPEPASGGQSRRIERWQWLVAGTALAVVALVSGGLGWLVAVRQWHGPRSQPIVVVPSIPKEAPQVSKGEQAVKRPDSLEPNQPATPLVKGEPPAKAPIATLPNVVQPTPQGPANVDQGPELAPQQSPAAVVSRSPSRGAVSITELTFHTPLGLLLVDARGKGQYRVAQGRMAVEGPLELVSLAESWSSIEVPNFGTIVWEGPAEAQLAVLPDGLVEIQLRHGKLAIHDMAKGARVRLETSGATWTSRGIDERSTLAVFDDPLTPSVVVAQGAVAVEELRIGPQQVVRWREGVPQAPQPLASADAGAQNLAWLNPPDERRQKQWNTMFGKLVEKVAEADDARAELNRLLTINKDPRQAALLAQWNVSIADQASQWQQTWGLLMDRREALRVAGVKALLGLVRSGDRPAERMRFLQEKLGVETTQHVIRWVAAARQPGQLTALQAAELAEHLGHANLAVRQIAVWMLELHVAPAFQKGLFKQPAYDAAASASRRAAAQAEWRLILRQLYTPSRRNPAAVLVKPIQPATGTQNAGPSVP